jgi:ankyrin repeat protein
MQIKLLMALLLASVSAGFAQGVFRPDAQLTNEIDQARARLRAQQPNVPPAQLERLAEVHGRSNRLASLIVAAISSQDFTNAATLLKEFPGSVDDLRQYGQPLLYRVVNEDKAAMLDFLLEQRANPDIETPFGEPVLAQAIQFRRWSMAEKLVRAGASMTRTNRQGRNIAGLFFEYWYPGSMPSDQGWTNLIPLLLERGLDPFARASVQGEASIVEECLSREAGYHGSGMPFWSGVQPPLPRVFYGDLLLTNRPGPARRTPLGDTALHLAVRWQRTNAVEFLLASGFDINQTNNAGLTPLQTVASSDGMALGGISPVGISIRIPPAAAPASVLTPSPKLLTMADYLLGKGATVDIFSAASLGNTNALAVLLGTNTALVNARDGYGRTPLHYAVLGTPDFLDQRFTPISTVAAGRLPATPFAPSNARPDTVSLLLKAGADPSAATTLAVPAQRNTSAMPAGTTPLHLAARAGKAALVRALLSARANVKIADANGDTALHLAARTWSSNAVSSLLLARAPIETTNRAGQTPLRAAVEAGVSSTTALLLKAGANPTNGLAGTTLVHLAAQRGDAATLAILLKHGLALEGRDGEGRTPLQCAIAAKAWNSIKFLREQGADFNAADRAGNTALHLLAAEPYDDISRVPDQPWWITWQRDHLNTAGWTGRALRWLVASKVINPPPAPGWTNHSLSVWLAQQGAKVNVTNRAGQTPLHALSGAPWLGWGEVARATNRFAGLLAAGARLDIANTNGLTPLHVAATNASPPVLALLLQNAAGKLNPPDRRGRTLLHYAVAAARDDAQLVATLLAAGADPNALDADGVTPLGLVMADASNSSWNRNSLLSLLLTNRANPNLADLAGQTPLHRAMLGYATNVNYPLRDMVVALLAHGANPNLTNRAGQTPLHILAQPSHSFAHPAEHLGDVLLTNRWNFAARDRAGQTPVHLWATSLQNCWSCTELYKKILLTNNLLNLTNAAGDTPLHVAIRAHQDQLARLLAQAGADLRLKNARGETPLRLAVERSTAFMDQEIRPAGTQHRFFDAIRLRNIQDLDRWLDADPSLASLTNTGGVTPLLAATDADSPGIVQRLLALGAPLDVLSALRLGRMEDFHRLLTATPRPPPNEWLFDAVRFERREGLQALVTAGADVNTVDADGHSLLFRANSARENGIADWLTAQHCRRTLFDAVVAGERAEVEAFLKADAAGVNVTNRNGLTPLYRAVCAGRQEMVALLLARGAKADATMPGGWTALHAAAVSDAAELAQMLLAAGAPPNQLEARGMGALHLAAALGATNVAVVLLEHGADVNLIPPSGGSFRNSPLHWAAHRGQVGMFQLLLAQGADLNARNSQNQTPLENARATTRGMFWGFSQPPGTRYKYDPAMHQPAQREARLKQLEAAAAKESTATQATQ